MELLDGLLGTVEKQKKRKRKLRASHNTLLKTLRISFRRDREGVWGESISAF